MRKLYVLLVLIGIGIGAQAQGKRKSSALKATKESKKEKPIAKNSKRSGANKGKPNLNEFLEQQWWLGFKAGTNLAQADPSKRYTILTPTNYSPSLTDKTYDAFGTLGFQASLEFSYYYKGFYFSTQPTYTNSTFTYSNELQWFNQANAAETLTQTYKQNQKVEYVDFPLIIKYDITGNKLRPFVQIGVFYSVLLNAAKTVNVSSVDLASGGTNTIDNQPIIVGAKDLFSNYWGLMGGVGVTYQLGNVRLLLDANYKQSMSNISNPENRFSNDRLSGIGDVQDDLNLKNITISAGVLFPLRFLSGGFKSNDR
jgi:hypothetical protein